MAWPLGHLGSPARASVCSNDLGRPGGGVPLRPWWNGPARDMPAGAVAMRIKASRRALGVIDLLLGSSPCWFSNFYNLIIFRVVSRLLGAEDHDGIERLERVLEMLDRPAHQREGGQVILPLLALQQAMHHP